MRQLSVDDSLVGETLSSSIKVPSPKEDVQYLVRIESGTTLSASHVRQLRRAGVASVRVSSPGDPERIIDERLEEEERRVVGELQEFSGKIRKDQLDSEDLEELNSVVDEMIETLHDTGALSAFTSLKNHHTYTAQHSFDVARLTLGLAMENEYFLQTTVRDESGASISSINRHLLRDLGVGALLHDIGKWKVDKEILNKDGRLTEEEWESIREHPRIGFELLRDLDVSLRAPALAPVLHHHEEWNGDGYPIGQPEKEIHWSGRLVKICDVYSALTSDRPYRGAQTPARALETMESMSARSFDPDLWKLFRSHVPPYPVGTEVHLPGGLEGVVVDLEEGFERPRVRITRRNGNYLREAVERVVPTDRFVKPDQVSQESG